MDDWSPVKETLFEVARRRFAWLLEAGFEIQADRVVGYPSVTLVGPRGFVNLSLDPRDWHIDDRIGLLQGGVLRQIQIFLPREPAQVTDVGMIPLMREAGAEPPDGFADVSELTYEAIDRAVAQIADAVWRYGREVLNGDAEPVRRAAATLLSKTSQWGRRTGSVRSPVTTQRCTWHRSPARGKTPWPSRSRTSIGLPYRSSATASTDGAASAA